MKRTLDEEYIRSLLAKENYVFFGTFVNTRTKIQIACPVGHKYSTLLGNWDKGNRCKKCYNLNRRKKINDIENELLLENYVLLSKKYVNANTKLRSKCPKNHIHNFTWGHWYTGQRCRKCHTDSLKNKFSEIKEKVEKEGYVLLTTEYKDRWDKLESVCPNGHKHNITWNSWLQNKRCLECSLYQSKGEEKIKKILEYLNVDFIREYRFSDCKNINSLPFDFAILNEGKVEKLIEFQGKHHYVEQVIFRKSTNLEQIKKNDLIKKEYCILNDIPLLIIPYTESNLEFSVYDFITNKQEKTCHNLSLNH